MKSVDYSGRVRFILSLMACVVAVIVWRLVDLNISERRFLQNQGDARTDRTIQEFAQRGMILDRNGEPLAVSAPVFSIVVDPQVINIFEDVGADVDKYTAEKKAERAKIRKEIINEFVNMAKVLGKDSHELIQRIEQSKQTNSRFNYLARGMQPESVERISLEHLRGVYKVREFQRYYPAAEYATHLVGFTDIDNKGQEGMELAFNSHLQAEQGKRAVKKDLSGRVIKDIRLMKNPVPGKNLQLSVDLRLQYVAYRELKTAVESHRAASGAAVILDVQTGEVLAMVNQPSYNPNNRKTMLQNSTRNRALTDVFEPGSTMKPLTMAAALMSGLYNLDSTVDTNPGYMRIKGKTIRDYRNYGVLDLTKIITKSSNVGASKLALSLPENGLRDTFASMGLGQTTTSGFPGESTGKLPYYVKWNPVNLATMSYGYGLSVTPLQLAHAYSIFAANGLKRPVSLLKLEGQPEAERVIPAEIAKQVVAMMETVVQPAGSGRRASIPFYTVAGKTGTVHKFSKQGGYQDDAYMAIFAGMVPASNPRLVCVVIVDEPKNNKYYGGEVSAPVFARIMTESLRLLNIAPDKT